LIKQRLSWLQAVKRPVQLHQLRITLSSHKVLPFELIICSNKTLLFKMFEFSRCISGSRGFPRSLRSCHAH